MAMDNPKPGRAGRLRGPWGHVDAGLPRQAMSRNALREEWNSRWYASATDELLLDVARWLHLADEWQAYGEGCAFARRRVEDHVATVGDDQLAGDVEAKT